MECCIYKKKGVNVMSKEDFFNVLNTLKLMGYLKDKPGGNNLVFILTDKGVDFCLACDDGFIGLIERFPWLPGLLTGGLSLAIVVAKTFM